jgi:hypothetical protein
LASKEKKKFNCKIRGVTASEQDEAVLRGDVTAGLRLVLNEAKGVPARFVFVKPATAAKGDERRVASLPSPQQILPMGMSELGTQNKTSRVRERSKLVFY